MYPIQRLPGVHLFRRVTENSEVQRLDVVISDRTLPGTGLRLCRALNDGLGVSSPLKLGSSLGAFPNIKLVRERAVPR